MPLSTYQIERLLERLRRFRGWLLSPEHPADAPDRPAPPDLNPVREQDHYPHRVEAERERRAGSFMDPPYPDEPAAPPIPRLKRGKDSSDGEEHATGKGEPGTS